MRHHFHENVIDMILPSKNDKCVKTSKFVACHVTNMWFLILWIEQKCCTLTSRKLLKRWCGDIYRKSEINYQTFNKIQVKGSFVCPPTWWLIQVILLCSKIKVPQTISLKCVSSQSSRVRFYVLCWFLSSTGFQVIV